MFAALKQQPGAARHAHRALRDEYLEVISISKASRRGRSPTRLRQARSSIAARKVHTEAGKEAAAARRYARELLATEELRAQAERAAAEGRNTTKAVARREVDALAKELERAQNESRK